MTRTIHLTVRIKMAVESDAEPKRFFDSLVDLLKNGLGERLPSSAETVEVIALHDPERTLTQQPYVETMLADFGAAASTWYIGDVKEICPSLSDEDALTVLRSTTDRSDAYCGIQAFSIQDAIEGVLGIDSDSGLPIDNTRP